MKNYHVQTSACNSCNILPPYENPLYQWRLYWFVFCLKLAESFSTSSSLWKMLAESFLVTSIQLAGSVWMPVQPKST